jgi:hypothetical protein
MSRKQVTVTQQERPVCNSNIEESRKQKQKMKTYELPCANLSGTPRMDVYNN